MLFQAVTEVLTVAALFGQHWRQVGLPHPIPIACVGCGDADKVRQGKENSSPLELNVQTKNTNHQCLD